MLPILQLSNRDLGLSMPACGLGGTPPMPMTGDDAVMAVVIDMEAVNGSLSDTVQQGEDLAIDGSGEPDDDLCGSGYYRKFVADEIPYVAWASFGPDVSEADRAVALDALTLAGGGFIGGAGAGPSPAYVLAGTDGGRLELTPSNRDGGNVDLALVSVSGRSAPLGTGDFTVPDVPVEDCCSMGRRLPGDGALLVDGSATFLAVRRRHQGGVGRRTAPSTVGAFPCPGRWCPCRRA